MSTTNKKPPFYEPLVKVLVKFAEQALRDPIRYIALPVMQIGIKLLTALRTGIDTYRASMKITSLEWGALLPIRPEGLLNSGLIDLVFTASWFIGAYAGDGAEARWIRPYALGSAVALYLVMLTIGAGAEANPTVAYGVRLAAGVGLGFDIWRYFRDPIKDAFAKFVAGARALWHLFINLFPHEGDEIDVTSYAQSAFRRAARTSVRDQIKILKPELNKKINSQVLAALDELDFGKEIVMLPPAPPVVQPTTANVQRTTVNAQAVDRWIDVAAKLTPNAAFSRTDIQNLAGVGKTTAIEIINAGIAQGEIVQGARGVYSYVPQSINPQP